MPIEAVVKQATGLQDKYVEMVVSYIQFLQAKQKKESKPSPVERRQLGPLADKFRSIADDFDEPLDELKEYM